MKFNYSDHIDLPDLERFANRKADQELTKRISEHVGNCPACCETLLLLMELVDLDLPELGEPDPATDEKKSPSKWPNLLAGVGGFATAIGALGSKSLFGADHGHAYAQHAEDFSHDDVSSSNFDFTYHSGGQMNTDPHFAEARTAATDPRFVEPEKHFGQPASNEKSEYIQQQFPDTCAIQSQHVVLNQFHIPVTEEQLVREAVSKGIYHPGEGTSPEDVGKLLEAHGVEVHRYIHANQFNLAQELAQGHAVIVGVESGKLWHQHPLLDDIADHLSIGHADHALIVSGIDTSDPNNVKVIITDPGTGDVAKSYPLPQFLEAWEGSNFFMVSTAAPLPPDSKQMEHFDYNTGHLPMIGEAPFSFFHEISNALQHQAVHGITDHIDQLFHAGIHGESGVSAAWTNAVDHTHAPGHDMAQQFLYAIRGGISAGTFISLMDNMAASHSYGSIDLHHDPTVHPEAHDPFDPFHSHDSTHPFDPFEDHSAHDGHDHDDPDFHHH
jgi:hypothetical protein